MPSFDTRCPGLHLQPGASVVLGCVGELPGSRCTDFNPRARVGRDKYTQQPRPRQFRFQSTRPVWGATRLAARLSDWLVDFNPRAPCGARPQSCPSGHRKKRNFNPRAPCGARPWKTMQTQSAWNFNPRAPCGARRAGWNGLLGLIEISIHAPRVGRDVVSVLNRAFGQVISIHAPRVGRDSASLDCLYTELHFNPRAPCGARLAGGLRDGVPSAISIHAPRVGRDNADAFR